MRCSRSCVASEFSVILNEELVKEVDGLKYQSWHGVRKDACKLR